MQQGGSQYGVSQEMTPFTEAGNRTHMLDGGGGGRGRVSEGSDNLQQQEQQEEEEKKKSGDAVLVAEAASPISSRTPATAHSSGNFDGLAPVSGGFADDDALAEEEVELGVTGGNRWPRQETLALLKIRSSMDAAFRDVTLKGPLWEDVSRKLGELGYVRSAKKCKEKFENVHKYYKRTKEGRASRQDGKSYRFFSQLEAIHSGSNAGANPIIPITNSTPPPNTTTAILTPITGTNAVADTSIGIGYNNRMAGSSFGRMQPTTATTAIVSARNQIGVPRIGPDTRAPGTAITNYATAATTIAAGISFSSNTSSSSSSSESEDDDGLERGPSNTGSRKRKRKSSRSCSSNRKMMSFFEGLMKQVMEKQETMQQRFFETIEKREQDRMIREEAWKRQEMARLSREHEIMTQERAISASRDAAIIAFLGKITGQTIQLPPPIGIPAAPPPPQQSTVVTPTPPPPPPAPPHQHQQLKQQPQHHWSQNTSEVIPHHQTPHSTEEVGAVFEQQHQSPKETGTIGGGGCFDPTLSRWPKPEVHALIKLRSGLELRYQEAGPKGPLWEEISAGMQKMGYNRSAKRCKEKWENINKYFKKVKENNKKRPEDAKTCSYFHQLDALHRKKILGGSSSGGGGRSFDQNQSRPEHQQETLASNPITTTSLPERSDVLLIMPLPAPPPQPISQTTSDAETKNPNNSSNTKSDANTREQTSKKGLAAPSLFEEASSGVGGTAPVASAKRPEDTVKELMEQQQRRQQSVIDDYGKMREPDSDNLDQEDGEDDDEDEDEEGEEERKLGYKIQFQQQNANSSSGGGNAASSFLAMVQ
ncbi:hypothetical protein NE237_027279 [Protea cynaroides]|uniref:Myb-like domain-containing protein n=1 Tax=Protea cynaroides TaxID=273540 RepID=A0A9Q0JT09_9MAGN|nr:hypothetical protein NE237_027279 [Protea cynaroides]